MGSVKITHKMNQRAVKALFTGTQTGLGKDMAKRAIRVTAAAKRNLSRHPQRIDTGNLRASIHWEFVTIGGVPGFRVGTNLEYAIFVHDGTGIFGPRGVPIVPKQSKFLVFKSKNGKRVFAKQVKGMEANPFLKDAMKFAAY